MIISVWQISRFSKVYFGPKGFYYANINHNMFNSIIDLALPRIQLTQCVFNQHHIVLKPAHLLRTAEKDFVRFAELNWNLSQTFTAKSHVIVRFIHVIPKGQDRFALRHEDLPESSLGICSSHYKPPQRVERKIWFAMEAALSTVVLRVHRMV